MNLCIGNNNGNLVAQNNGGFWASCVHSYLTNGRNAAATCKQTNGQYANFVSSLDLNPFVENQDGYMWCFGHRSAPA
ncbi:hypothetical protein QBC35DRAFT_509552 [Podospora australis]|uniref:Cyanovirin-N domain-containing protein n=1 Tax=Podospora australis TaxID=1536484 RepID=A0AAN6WJN3_9PEZI|nr:hypothetical protein QBC35DRAFT_509552 [Podospora australis]